MTRSTRLFLFLTSVLFVIGITQGVLIYKQNQQIQLLQVTEYSLLSGNISETIHEVDRFTETQDRAVLENLYVRLTFMDREAHRAVELTNQEPISITPTTPSGLVGLILQDNVENEQAMDYLKVVQQKLLAYQSGVDPAIETEKNRLAFIRLWREITELAHDMHREWKLP